MKVFRAFGAIVIAGLVLAAPAHADESDYLARLRQRLPGALASHPDSQLLTVGRDVCTMLGNGADPVDVDGAVQGLLTVSRTAANWVQVIADDYLCSTPVRVPPSPFGPDMNQQ